jgi:hypothetical protein
VNRIICPNQWLSHHDGEVRGDGVAIDPCAEADGWLSHATDVPPRPLVHAFIEAASAQSGWGLSAYPCLAFRHFQRGAWRHMRHRSIIIGATCNTRFPIVNPGGHASSSFCREEFNNLIGRCSQRWDRAKPPRLDNTREDNTVGTRNFGEARFLLDTVDSEKGASYPRGGLNNSTTSANSGSIFDNETSAACQQPALHR